MEQAQTKKHSGFRIGLRGRFIIVISLVLILIFSLIAAVLLRNARTTLTTDLNQRSKVFAALATRPIGDAYNIYQSYGSLRVRQEVIKLTDMNSSVSSVTIVGFDGKSLYSTNADHQSVSTEQANSFDTLFSKNTDGAYTNIVVPYLDTNGQHQFAISYDISTAELEASITRSAETIIIFSLLGLLLAASVTYWLVNRLFLRPIEAVSRSSRAISQGNYDAQIVSERNDEIGDLALSVNQMATNLKQDIFKLQEVDTMKNEFIMITSHNLRTPLTIIEGYMEIIRDTELSDDLRKMIDSIEDGLRRLASFSEDILTIASIEGGKSVVTTRKIKMSNMLKGLEDTYQTAADQQHMKLEWHVENADTELNVSSIHIRGVMRNLLDNAIKFTHKDGTVRFGIEVKDKDLVITVGDTGIGIAPEEMGKLFQKFHRGTSTYQYNYEGTGIGLYATKLIVQAHHGNVTATSTLGQGSTFTVTIPNAVAEAAPVTTAANPPSSISDTTNAQPASTDSSS